MVMFQTGFAVRPEAWRAEMLHALEAIRDPDLVQAFRGFITYSLTKEQADKLIQAHIGSRGETIHSELARSYAELDKLNRETRSIDREKTALMEAALWLSTPAPAWRLQSAETPTFHKILPEGVYCASHAPPTEDLGALRAGMSGNFLVQHDWAGLLERADTDDGEWRLPFDTCCFEFRLDGRTLCMLVGCEDAAPYRINLLLRTKMGWVLVPEGEAVERLTGQVRAIAITLDAEVVRAETVRAPHKLNAQRERRHQGPIYSHHVLSLTRKQQASALEPDPDRIIYRKRLHFRRGHWRHYPSHKTWIRWCLAGDPALGFADKDYRL